MTTTVAKPALGPVQAPPPTKHEQVSECMAIVRNVDAHAREIERRWGTGQLPRLMPIDLMEKFNRQARKFDEAAFGYDPEQVRKHGEAMLRAFALLEQTALNAGFVPELPTQWEFTLKDGSLVVLVRDRAEMGQVDLKGRAAQLWSLDEIADIVARFPQLVTATKEAFPGAEVVSLRPSPVVIDDLNDSLADLPF